MANAAAEAEKNLGNDALKAQNFQKAIEHYSKAIELDGKNHVYYSNRSNAYVQVQKFEEALKDAQRTVELDPKWSRGYGRLGNALFFLGRYEEAEKAYSKGLELEPGNENYRQEEARCGAFAFAKPFLRPDWVGVLSTSPVTAKLMSEPKFVEKIQGIRANPVLLQALLNSDPEVQQAYIVLNGMEQEIRERQAREEAKRLEEQRKRREDLKKREEEEAARKKREAFAALPEHKQKAQIAKEAGNDAYKAQDYKKAIEQYNLAVESDPTEALYHNNIAAVLMAMKNYEAAVTECDKAIEKGKEHMATYETIGKAYSRKGKALSKLKRFKEAVEAYDTGLLSFRDPQAVKYRNQAEEKRKLQEAESYVDPAKGETAKNEGNEFFKQENWGEAIRCYSEAIRRNPKSAVYYNNRATTYMKVREYNLALADANKAVELDASFVKGWVRKGMAHHYMKEYYKALEAYDKGMKIDPNYPELTEWASRTSEAIQRMHTAGGKEEAEAARQRALADPEIRQLLTDGEVQNLMRTLQSGNRREAEEMLKKSSSLYAKYDKLSKSGII